MGTLGIASPPVGYVRQRSCNLLLIKILVVIAEPLKDE